MPNDVKHFVVPIPTSDYYDQIATRRKIDFDTSKVVYVCSSCHEEVECSLKSAVLRKDIGQYCGDTGETGLMMVNVNTLPVLDREFWKEKVNFREWSESWLHFKTN